MRIAILFVSLLIVAACGRQPDVYIVTTGTAAPAAEATGSGS